MAVKSGALSATPMQTEEHGEVKAPMWRRLVAKIRAYILEPIAIPYGRLPLQGSATKRLRLNLDVAALKKLGLKSQTWWIHYAAFLEKSDPRINFPPTIQFRDIQPFLPKQHRKILKQSKFRKQTWEELGPYFAEELTKSAPELIERQYQKLLRRMRILTMIGKMSSMIFSASSALATIGALIASGVAPGGAVLYLLAAALVFSTFYIRGLEALNTTPNTFINFFGGEYFCQGLIEYRNKHNQVVRMSRKQLQQLKLTSFFSLMAGAVMGFLSYNSLLLAFAFFSIPVLPYIIGPLVAIAVLVTFMRTLSSCRRLIINDDKFSNTREYFKSLFRPNHPRNINKKVWEVYLESSIAVFLIPTLLVLMAFNVYGTAYSGQMAGAVYFEKIPVVSATIAYWVAFSVLMLPSLCGRLIYGLSNAAQLALDISRGTVRTIDRLKNGHPYQRADGTKEKYESNGRSFFAIALDLFCCVSDAFTSSLFATQNNLAGSEKVMVVAGAGVKPLSIVAGSSEEAKALRDRRAKAAPPMSLTTNALIDPKPPLTTLYKTQFRTEYRKSWEAEDFQERKATASTPHPSSQLRARRLL